MAYHAELFDDHGPGGNEMKIDGLRITLNPHAKVENPECLLVFGSDPKRCNVILGADGIDPVHCRVWAQLNSGPNVLVLDNHSAIGT